MPKFALFCRKSILVVSNDGACCLELKLGLERQGYDIKFAVDDVQAIRLLSHNWPCFVIVDFALDSTDTLMLLGAIREITDAYIMVLGERQAEDSLIVALELAADAYITKPFDLNKLQAHFRAYHRRCGNEIPNDCDKLDIAAESRSFSRGEEELTAELVDIKPADKTFAFADFLFNGIGFGLRTRDGVAVELAPRELALLQLLIANKGSVTTEQDIFRYVFKTEIVKDAGALRTLVSRLRRKLKEHSGYDGLIVGSPRFGFTLGANISDYN